MADTSQSTASVRMTPSLREALRDCAGFEVYWWKQARMAKLATMGLVIRLPARDRAGQLAYSITEAGKEALRRG